MHITSGLHRAAAIKPLATAYRIDGRSVTWSAYRDRIARAAGLLRSLGLGTDDRVAVLSDNTAVFLELFMAAPWADLILASLNTRWSAPEMAAALNDADADVLVVDRRFAPLVGTLRAARPGLRCVFYADTGSCPEGLIDWEASLAASDPIEDSRRGGDSIGYLVYTSGTTGRLKAAMLTMSNIVSGALMVMHEFGYSEDVVFLCCAPLFHTGGSTNVMTHILQGSTLALLPRFDALAVAEAIERDRATHIQMVPTMIQMLLDLPEIDRFDLSTVQRIFYGAAPMPPSLISRARARLPGVGFQQGYGLTESSAVGTSLRPEDHAIEGRLGSVGRAVPGVEIRITDPDGVDLPVGAIGEVRILSPAVMAGYWRQPDQTAEALDQGWLRTGDGGRLDADGYLFLTDRLKDMIISGGENIFSSEIENAVYAWDEVLECAAIGLPDARWGEIVVVFARLHPGAMLSEESLLAGLRSRLSGFKTPRRIFIQSEPLPRNGAGKIMKAALKEACHG